MRVESLGSPYEVPDSKLNGPAEPEPGKHLWVITGAWRVDPVKYGAGDTVLMDQENMLQVAGPMCYWCEQEWSFRVASRPCIPVS